MSSPILSRLSKAQWSLRPQDLAVAFKLICTDGLRMSYAQLGRAMRLSPFEAHAAVMRLQQARLLAEHEGVLHLVLPAFKPFVLQGACYFFPAVRGEITIGFATAHATQPLKELMMQSDELPPVWPHAEGPVRGMSVLPLYPKLPLAAQDDAQLYELLALFDVLRMGQARERELARNLLGKRLQPVAMEGEN